MSRKLTFDTWLFAAAMLIVVVGLVMIYSASAMIATQRFGHRAVLLPHAAARVSRAPARRR